MAEFDLSLYLPVPLLTNRGYVSLYDTLIAVAPTDPPAHVTAAIDGLKLVVGEARAALVTRLGEDASTGSERAFDGVTSIQWNELRSRLEFYDIYEHEGFNQLTDADRVELEFDRRKAQARVAKQVRARLFGSGSDFLALPFAEQATEMDVRLDWLDGKDLIADLEGLVSADLVSLILRTQLRYKEMVVARSSRDGRSSTNLRELRDRLRRQLYAYLAAVATMAVPSEAASIEVVEAALRPILVARQQARRKPFSGEFEPESGETTEPFGSADGIVPVAAGEGSEPSDEGAGS